MKGLLLLAPVLSCGLALSAYLLGGGLWAILGAFFLGGPGLMVLIGLVSLRRSDDTDCDKPGMDPDA